MPEITGEGLKLKNDDIHTMKPVLLIVAAIVLIAFTAFVVVTIMGARNRKQQEIMTRQARESAVREFQLKSDTARLGGLLKSVLLTSKKRTDSLTKISHEIVTIDRYIPVRRLDAPELERILSDRYRSELAAEDRPVN